MTNDEAMKLARDLMPRNAGQSVLVTSADLRKLCHAILSGDHKREIENAALERAIMAVRAIRLKPPYTAIVARDNACDAIRALIQPPAQPGDKP